MMQATATSDALQLLSTCRLAYLCTVSRETLPHVVPVFFIFDERSRCIYLITSPRSRKVLNMTQNPRVSLAVDERDPVDPFNNRGLMIQGIAEIGRFEESSDEGIMPSLMDVFEAFEEKYPTFRFRGEVGLEEASEVLVKVELEKVVYWAGPSFANVKV